MKRLLLIAFLLIPVVAAQTATVTNIRVEAGNQILQISWDPVAGAAGYTVQIHGPEGGAETVNVTSTSATTRNVINDRPYAVAVAARHADGSMGPWSAPVAAVPTHGNDLAYLALGLAIVWIGIWLYAALLARTERDLLNRIDALETRPGEKP